MLSMGTADCGRTALRLRDRLATLKPELLAFARSLARDSAEAEDLAQEAVVRALQAARVPAAAAELRPWMFRLIRNLFIDERRRDRVRREYSEGPGRFFGDRSRTASDPVQTVMVRQAFDRLVERDREILCLVDVLGMSYAEASAVLGVPLGTVMSRLSRARRAMIGEMAGAKVQPLKARRG